MIIGINASFLRKQNTGIGQVSANFLKKLAEVKSGKGNVYFLYLEEDIDLELPTNFCKVIFLPPYKRDDLIRKIWWEKFSLPRRVKKDNCDVMLSLYQCPTVLHGKKVKHIMLVHDLIPKLFPQYLNNARKKLYQKLTEHAIKKADKILTVSHRSEKDLIQHLSVEAHKISVNYIDTDQVYKNEVTDGENKKVLEKYKLEAGYIYSGGGMEVRKNVEGVLRAYKTLFEAYGHASWLPKLVISGKLMPQLAPLATDTQQLVEGLELKEQVVLLDYVPQEDLPALYRNAKVFVYPSFYEGFGLPVLEAMNQGAPVITAKTSSLPEVGADSVLYCDPNNVDDLAMVMKNVLTNNHLQTALSLKGKERATHFSWDKFVEKFLHIIEAK